MRFIKVLVITGCFVFLLGCKEGKKGNEQQDTVEHLEENSAIKELRGSIEAVVDGQALEITQLDPEKSTDLVLLKNGLQFKVVDTEGRSVLVNMYTPGFWESLPRKVSAIQESMKPEEAMQAETKAKLEILIPDGQPSSDDIKLFYKGEVVLKQFSTQQLRVNFKGTGVPGGTELFDRPSNQFSMEGQILISGFQIYDMRK